MSDNNVRKTNDYPASAEQYLIQNYENALALIEALKLENKSLKKEIQELTPEPLENNEDDEQKVVVFPTLKVIYHVEGSDYGYYINRDNIKKYKKILKEKTLDGQNDNHYYLHVSEANVAIDILGNKFYAKFTPKSKYSSLYLGIINEADGINRFEDRDAAIEALHNLLAKGIKYRENKIAEEDAKNTSKENENADSSNS